MEIIKNTKEPKKRNWAKELTGSQIGKKTVATYAATGTAYSG